MGLELEQFLCTQSYSLAQLRARSLALKLPHGSPGSCYSTSTKSIDEDLLWHKDPFKMVQTKSGVWRGIAFYGCAVLFSILFLYQTYLMISHCVATATGDLLGNVVGQTRARNISVFVGRTFLNSFFVKDGLLR